MSDAGEINSNRQTGLPQDFPYQILNWERFDTLNTKPPRPAIADGECFWLDGWMPIGPSNARVLPGTGPTAFTASTSTTIVWMGFGNIGDTRYGVILQSNGALYVFDTDTLVSTQIMSNGTILSPTSIFGFSQWGSQYLIFSKDQENGYWLWDGTNIFTAGTLGPEVTLTNAGDNYSSAPDVTLQTTGSAINTAFTAQVENGSVTKVTVTNPGSGFAVGDFSSVYFAGGGSDDQAVAGVPTPTTTTGGVSQILVANGGNGYTARAYGVFTGGGGSGAIASLSITNGTITDVAIVNAGSGYTSAPTFTVTDPGIPGSGGSAIPGGTGFSGFCNIAFGQIAAINISYGGSGYVSPPTVTILGDGINATAIAQIAAGQVTNVIMKNLGSGYTKALVVFEGGNNAANATVMMMPFGVSGTWVETFQGRVFVGNGSASAAFPPKTRVLFSAANSPVNFSSDGGVFLSTDSFLRVGYHWGKQSNGFLYLGGDSSVNYISNVSTTASGTTPVTTLSNLNVDPQIGSPWPSSVQVFGRNLVFANPLGIFVSYGGAVTKASLPLDGFYASANIFAITDNFSAAVAQVFGIQVYMLLMPVVDQFTGNQVNKLLMYDGKRWFTSQQDKTLTFIATQEVNSVMTAWGTNGTTVFQLFNTPTTDFTKVIQSKLFASPGYYTTKTALRMSGAARSYAVDDPITIFLDNEVAQGTANAEQEVTVATNIEFLNQTGHIVEVLNAGLDPVTGTSTAGLIVFGPYAMAQNGRMIGITVTTTASDLALLGISLAEQAPFSVNL